MVTSEETRRVDFDIFFSENRPLIFYIDQRVHPTKTKLQDLVKIYDKNSIWPVDEEKQQTTLKRSKATTNKFSPKVKKPR